MEIDNGGLKAPLLPRFQGEGQGIARKSRRGSGDGGAARHDPSGRDIPAGPSAKAKHRGLEMPSFLALRQRRPHGGGAGAQPPCVGVTKQGLYGWNFVPTGVPSWDSEEL